MSSVAFFEHPVYGQDPIYLNNHIVVDIPKEQLTYQSFTVEANEKSYLNWDTEDHRSCYLVMQTAAKYFENGPFLVFGENSNGNHSSFKWEFVPFKQTTNVFARYWQQLQVAFGVIFGRTEIEKGDKGIQKSLFEKAFDEVESVTPENSDGKKSNDPFCNDKIIEDQQVLEGNLVRVLYDYRPVGDSHFLVVPKAHRRDFRQLTEEEYTEAAKLSQFIIERLKENQQVSNVYMMHKTQIDAGQSVLHWHMHVITTANAQDDFLSKVKFLWRMTFGSSPIDKNELTSRVNQYKDIFKN